jgi:hypothetical protein
MMLCSFSAKEIHRFHTNNNPSELSSDFSSDDQNSQSQTQNHSYNIIEFDHAQETYMGCLMFSYCALIVQLLTNVNAGHVFPQPHVYHGEKDAANN